MSGNLYCPMRDRDLRPVLRKHLIATHAAEEGAVLLEELGLRCGSARADLVVVNGVLKGYEIKSQHDTLMRLKDQSYIYSQIFDTATLVVAERHLEKAQTIIPQWWGIELAISNELGVTLQTIRGEDINPSVDPRLLVQLLWREEVITILESLSTSKAVRNKSRKMLWEILVTELPLVDLKQVVRNLLKNRKEWQVVVPQKLDGEKCLLSSTSSDSRARSSRARIRRYIYRPS